MRLTVSLFGSLRDRFGKGASVQMEVGPGIRLREALRKFEGEQGALGADVAVALNGSLTRADPELADGDEILLLPPVSGG